MRHVLLMVVLTTGCGAGSSSEEETVAAYQATIADARELVLAHEQAVQEATTLDEVGQLEDTYLSDWSDLHAEMQQQMDDVRGCGMDEDTSGMMDDATMTMGDLDDDVAGHVADHDTHADVAQCHDGESEHMSTMMEGFDRMSSDGDDWLADGMMSCSMM